MTEMHSGIGSRRSTSSAFKTRMPIASPCGVGRPVLYAAIRRGRKGSLLLSGVRAARGRAVRGARTVGRGLRKRPAQWVDFLVRFEPGLEAPDASRAWKGAITIGGAYAVGGLFPLVPYMFASSARSGLVVSCCVTAAAL